MTEELDDMYDLDDDTKIREYKFYDNTNSSEDNKRGWGIFSEEMAWFLYDFFKEKLDGYEKLLFYSYYINGFTCEEIGKILEMSTQAASMKIVAINKKLRKTWHNRKSWR